MAPELLQPYNRGRKECYCTSYESILCIDEQLKKKKKNKKKQVTSEMA
jgi:hypothetical protein